MSARGESELPGLPTLLQPGLRLVFIGYNPGLESARRGHYYAFRGNVFWRQMAASGLVPPGTGWADDARLPHDHGIGFTDLCERPTARADELSQGELAAGALTLYQRLAAFQPEVAVFSGRGIFEVFGRHALELSRSKLHGRPYGKQAEQVGETALWVIPSSSGLASRWHAERLELLKQMASHIRT